MPFSRLLRVLEPGEVDRLESTRIVKAKLGERGATLQVEPNNGCWEGHSAFVLHDAYDRPDPTIHFTDAALALADRLHQVSGRPKMVPNHLDFLIKHEFAHLGLSGFSTFNARVLERKSTRGSIIEPHANSAAVKALLSEKGFRGWASQKARRFLAARLSDYHAVKFFHFNLLFKKDPEAMQLLLQSRERRTEFRALVLGKLSEQLRDFGFLDRKLREEIAKSAAYKIGKVASMLARENNC